MSLRKLKRVVKIVDAAMRDGARARSQATDPAFREGLQTDRRRELSKFKTVQHALADPRADREGQGVAGEDELKEEIAARASCQKTLQRWRWEFSTGAAAEGEGE